MATTGRVRLGEWITTAWQLWKAQWSVWSLMSVVYFIPVGIIYGLAQFFNYRLHPSVHLEDVWRMILITSGQSLLRGLVTSFLVIAVTSFFMGGLFRAAFRQLRGETIAFEDMFSGGDLYIRIFVASVIIGVIEFLSSFLCYVPMLIARGLLWATVPLIVARGMEPLDALKLSFETTRSEWLMFTVFAFVTNVLAFLGLFACGIGIVFSYPLLFLITAVAYRDLFEKPAGVPEGSRTIKYCRSCGSPLPYEAGFCDRCGAGQT